METPYAKVGSWSCDWTVQEAKNSLVNLDYSITAGSRRVEGQMDWHLIIRVLEAPMGIQNVTQQAVILSEEFRAGM
jgi:hypothetical protein